MTRSWKSHLWRNTVTNYLRTAVRFATGFFIFRMLFQHFSKEQFGFWSLLWSVFAYTVLLDFGFGYTAYREAARGNASGDWLRFNRLMSTMFWTFLGIGLVVFVVFIGIHDHFLAAIRVSAAEHASISNAYWIFFGALAVAFPMGIFPEILAGLQRLDLTNWMAIVGSVVNLVLVKIGMQRDWPFETFVAIGVLTSLGPTFMSFFLVRHLIPQISLSPRLYHFLSLREVLGFSLSVYVITMTNIIVSQTDQLVTSLCIGVAAVTVFQAGAKVSEMFGTFMIQMQGALDSTAAHLHATGDVAMLRHLLIRTTRLVVLITSPAYALAAVYLDPLIRLVTGLKEVDRTSYLVGQLLLCSVYSSLVATSCAKRVLTMAGWEKPLVKISLLNAFANLGLSVLLVFKYGLPGVALGTIIPGVLTGWFGVVPLTLKFAQISVRDWLREVYAAVAVPVGTSLALLGAFILLWPHRSNGSFIAIVLRGVVVMAPVMYFSWRRRAQLV